MEKSWNFIVLQVQKPCSFNIILCIYEPNPTQSFLFQEILLRNFGNTAIFISFFRAGFQQKTDNWCSKVRKTMNFVYLISCEMIFLWPWWFFTVKLILETLFWCQIQQVAWWFTVYSDQLCMAFFDMAIENSVQTEWSHLVSALVKLITYAKPEVRTLRMTIEILYRLNGDIL